MMICISTSVTIFKRIATAYHWGKWKNDVTIERMASLDGSGSTASDGIIKNIESEQFAVYYYEKLVCEVCMNKT